MSTIVTRAGKGTPLTHTEADANFTNLNTDKLEINPALGTPVSGVLTNCTELPIATGVAGLGANVATALAVAVGSAGAPVVFNGAGGTPSSMTGTNITGTAAGLTAGNVTTNANLTGHVTSTGNAAVLGSFTLAQLNTAISDGDVPIAATQTDQETGTSTTTFVSPGRQQFHPSAAKAWGYATYAAGVPTLAANFNISGIVDNGLGDIDFTIGTDMSTGNFASGGSADAGASRAYVTQTFNNSSAAYVRVLISNDAGGASDPTTVSMWAFGDQA